MTDVDFDRFPWISPWRRISARGREAYENELKLEMTPGHPLYGTTCRALARNTSNDDVLFLVPDPFTPLARVHLTFIGRPERQTQWPAVTLFADLSHWVMECMMPDAARFEMDPFNRAA